MSGFELAHLDEIEEITDGRCPFQPVRPRFGISPSVSTPGSVARRATGSSTSTTRRGGGRARGALSRATWSSPFELDGER